MKHRSIYKSVRDIMFNHQLRFAHSIFKGHCQVTRFLDCVYKGHLTYAMGGISPGDTNV